MWNQKQVYSCPVGKRRRTAAETVLGEPTRNGIVQSDQGDTNHFKKKSLRIIVELLTGHCKLRISTDTVRRFWEESDETSTHGMGQRLWPGHARE